MLQAKHDKIILQKAKSEEKRLKNVILSDVNGEKAEIFEVVSTGPGRYNEYHDKYIPTEFQVGDKVYVKKGLLHEFDYEGETYFITRDIEILGKIV